MAEYVKTTWVERATALGPTNLNKMEDGIAAALPSDSVRAAGLRILENKLSAGDSQPSFRVSGDGRIEWGVGGASALDNALSRFDANHMQFSRGLLIGQNVYLDFSNIGSKLYFGSAADTNLYRASANVLQTDDAFWTTEDIIVRLGQVERVVIGAAVGGGTAGFTFGSAGDVNLYRASGNLLKTDDALNVNWNNQDAIRLPALGGINWNGVTYLAGIDALNIGYSHNFQAGNDIIARSGYGGGSNAALVAIGQRGPASQAGIVFGSLADTNLYRSAADTLATDDDLRFETVGKGPIVRSPDGLIRRRIGIDNAGSLTLTAV